jgi:hypothetical protein
VLAALQASTIVTMALGSRLPQILLNWRRGDAGMLSVTSCGLNVAGNAARVFTTLVLTRDPLLLGGIVTQGAPPAPRAARGAARAARRGARRAAARAALAGASPRPRAPRHDACPRALLPPTRPPLLPSQANPFQKNALPLFPPNKRAPPPPPPQAP